MAKLFTERRKERRRSATGKVELLLRDPLPEKIEGRLVDISAEGFRASHKYSGLSSGHEVYFHHDSAEGQARVMWTRVLSGRAETGFLILHSATEER